MATATAMYHSGVNPLRAVRHGASEEVRAVKGLTQRRLHKAFLRYHDADNWPVLREALQRMGRGDLIGSKPDQLVPERQPAGWVAKDASPEYVEAVRKVGLKRVALVPLNAYNRSVGLFAAAFKFRFDDLISRNLRDELRKRLIRRRHQRQ